MHLLLKTVLYCLPLPAIFVLYNVLSIITGIFNSGYMTTGKITYASLAAKNHFIFIVGILCLFGSCMLLYKDRTGWLLCIVTSLLYAINLFISSRSKATD